MFIGNGSAAARPRPQRNEQDRPQPGSAQLRASPASDWRARVGNPLALRGAMRGRERPQSGTPASSGAQGNSVVTFITET
jgi:hypothetical protein